MSKRVQKKCWCTYAPNSHSHTPHSEKQPAVVLLTFHCCMTIIYIAALVLTYKTVSQNRLFLDSLVQEHMNARMPEGSPGHSSLEQAGCRAWAEVPPPRIARWWTSSRLASPRVQSYHLGQNAMQSHTRSWQSAQQLLISPLVYFQPSREHQIQTGKRPTVATKDSTRRRLRRTSLWPVRYSTCFHSMP